MPNAQAGSSRQSTPDDIISRIRTRPTRNGHPPPMSTLSEMTIGFVGLGNMGRPMAANLARGHGALRVYDQAGTASRAPDGSVVCDSVADLSASPNPGSIIRRRGATFRWKCCKTYNYSCQWFK